MATRKIKDAIDLESGERIYIRGHAKATYMSDGRTVEDAINAGGGGKTPTIEYPDAECRAAFLAAMNDKAKEIGMDNTTFYDPTGRTNVTTAHDMCRCTLVATGYERLQDIWSVPKREISFIQPDGSIRKTTLTHTLIDSAFVGSYNPMGGKGGSLNGGKTMPDGGTIPSGKYVSNMACVLQSQKNPDDFYAITTMSMYDDKATAYDTKIGAIKDVMAIIEAGEGTGGDNSPLDTVVYEGKTYRDIFINSNLAPNVNAGIWTKSVQGKTVYSLNSSAVDTPTIEKDESTQDNYLPPYALKISSGKSCNILTNSSSTVVGIKDHTYLAAVNVNITNYTAGKLGVACGANADFCGADGVTNGFQTYARKLTPTSTSSGTVMFYAGSLNNANLTGLVNNPVLVDTNIFNVIPSDAEWLALYEEFNAIMVELYEQGTDTPQVAVAADYVCAFKIPKYNTRSFRNIELTPAYAKNANTTFYPASMSKIMTAMVTLDNVLDLNEKITLRQEDIDAFPTTSWYGNDILLGETMTIKDVLYIMMMPSSNIATEMLSRVVGNKILSSKNL